ncbi:MAG: methyltransferase domain-containing protein [Aeromicrobium sp.]
MASPLSRLRSALSSSPAPAPAPAAKPARQYGPYGVSGRLLREVGDLPRAGATVDREGDDPTEVAAVRAGWLLLDAYERMTRRGADRVFGHELDAWHAYADTLAELEYTLPDGRELKPENRKNRLRFRRTVDFAREGEVVFDVGFGHGLLAASLIKDRGIKKYFGIDIIDRYVPTATGLFAVNGLAPETLELEAQDLYTLTRERIAATGATLVICCEVLEHVPDAELALKTLADALPEGADLLFSVPMHGRIEGAWGHVSVFDVARLKGMLDGAGLYAHHVEPLANAWSIVVASRDPAPSRRVREATGRPPERVSRPLSAHRDYVYLAGDDFSAVGPSTVERQSDQTARWQFSSGGGYTFAVESLESLRLWFNPVDADQVSRMVATAYAGDTKVGHWVWKRKPGQMTDGVVLSTALRAGEVGLHFIGDQNDDAVTADRIEVLGRVEGGGQAEIEIGVAYLP